MAEVLKIQKWGNSQGIRIPKKILKTLDLSINDNVLIEEEKDCIKIKKIEEEKRKTIKELFANYEGDYKSEEIDWGEPVGREIEIEIK